MKHTLVHITIIIFLIIGISDVSGQTRKVHFEKPGVRDGLPQSHIFTMMQDRDDYMWFCTKGGLSKYDGQRFVNYFHDRNDSTTISGNWIYKIVEAEGDLCYVATTNGFNIFNKRNETFRRFRAHPDQKGGLINHRIHDIAIASDKKVWLAHAKGISCFDPRTEHFQNFTHPEFTFSRHSPSVAITHDGQVFAGSEYGLYTIKPDSSGLDYIPIIIEGTKCRVRQISQRHGRLWLATNHGLITYDRHTRNSKKVSIPLPDKTPSVNSFVWDTDSTVYIGGSIGLHRVKTATGELLESYNYAADNPEGISGDVVYSLLIDKEKNIWAGLFDGINVINPNAESFRVYYNEPGLKNLKNSTLIIYTTKEGEIWTSTMKGIWYKPSIDAKAKIIDFSGYLKYQHFPAMGFAEDAQGTIWISYKHKGLVNNAGHKFDFTLKKTREWMNGAHPKQILSSKYDRNQLWLATNKGLLNLNTVTTDTLWVQPEKYDNSLKSNSIGPIAEDDEGIIWFISNGRLCSFTPRLNRFKAYRSDPRDSTAWFGSGAYRIAASGNKVFLSGASFSYYDKTQKRFFNYTKESSPPIGGVASVTVDQNGDAWFPRGSEIWHFNSRKNDLTPYNINHLGGGYYTSSANTAPDGRVLFGGQNGITEIRPWQVHQDTQSTRVVLSDVIIDNQRLKTAKALQFTDTIQLSYKNTLLVIQYSALKYMRKGGLQYRYKLKGQNENWINLGNRTEVTFNELAPGKYNLVVEASNTYGAKCKNPLKLYIFVKPPFWQTNGFYAFVVFAGLVMIWLIYRNLARIQKLKQEKTIAEQNDQYKSRFLAHMSHEFRTPMNAIMGLNHLLMHSGLNEEQLKYTESIKSSCDNLLWMVNNILDQAKIESGTIKLQNTAFKPREVFQQVYNLLNLKAEEKGLSLKLESDANLPEEIMGDPVRVFQILVNLTANAIKFTQKGHVSISARSENHSDYNKMILEVQDTGIGIEEKALERIFDSFEQVGTSDHLSEGAGLGLAIVKQLLNSMKGEIFVKSEINEGSIFTVQIPYVPVGLDDDKLAGIAAGSDLPDNLEVLIVEDLETNRFVAIQLLKLYNETIKVSEAENGVQALELIRNKKFDVVLMDVRMPVMDGIVATKEIRKLGDKAAQKLPIIGLTANATPMQLEACISAGMNACVTKPIDLDELIEKLKGALRSSS